MNQDESVERFYKDVRKFLDMKHQIQPDILLMILASITFFLYNIYHLIKSGMIEIKE